MSVSSSILGFISEIKAQSYIYENPIHHISLPCSLNILQTLEGVPKII